MSSQSNFLNSTQHKNFQNRFYVVPITTNLLLSLIAQRCCNGCIIAPGFVVVTP